MKDTDTASNSSTFQVCRPVSKEHRRGVRWFASITHALEGSHGKQSLQHCIQFYSCYAETGDQRYLSLCEDFLTYAIKAMDRRAR